MLKVIHLSVADHTEGAARAAYRLHEALRASGVDSRMWVSEAAMGEGTVEAPTGRAARALTKLRRKAVKPCIATLRTGNPVLHSPAVFPSGWVRRINRSDADVVHLHWTQREMLSIADIGRIEKPVVWTLHDMWAFCGAEHYTDDERWRHGYCRQNRPPHETGFDLNRWTWRRKCKHWQKPMHIVAPSRWLAACARESALMHEWPVTVVPNCLDTASWTPLDQAAARDLLALPADVPLLLFGALWGGRDPRKGFDLLQAALSRLRDLPGVRGMELVVFGQSSPQRTLPLGFPVHYTGHLGDDASLRALYSAADVVVVPSRQEAFGQTASEAHACGRPVVAFDSGGLRDIVEHRRSGYLAEPFRAEDLAQGIAWVLAQRESGLLGTRGREQAVARFSSSVVAEQYRAVYARAVGAG